MFKMVEFFNKQGKILTLDEYRALGTNVPVKDHHARRYWGTWNRIMAASTKLVKFDSELKVAEVLETKEDTKEKAPVTKPVSKTVTK